MTKAILIKQSNAKKVDLGTKVITKYTSQDKKLEANHVKISGRHPEEKDQFIYETDCHFLVYVINGSGTIFCDDDKFEVTQGDVVDVPPKTKYAVEGDLEYLALDTPAWYPEQAAIVDKNGNLIEDTKI